MVRIIHLHEFVPMSVDILRSTNVVNTVLPRRNSNYRSIFLMQFYIREFKIPAVDFIQIPEACEACEEGSWNMEIRGEEVVE